MKIPAMNFKVFFLCACVQMKQKLEIEQARGAFLVSREPSKGKKSLEARNYLVSGLVQHILLKALKVAQVEHGNPIWFVSTIRYAGWP